MGSKFKATPQHSTPTSASSSSNHVLPPEDTVPDEEPPPYTPQAEPGLSVSGMSNIPPYLQAQINTDTHTTPPIQPPRPPNQQQTRPPSSAYPGLNQHTYGQPQQSRPTQTYYQQPANQTQYQRPQYGVNPVNPNLPFTYPRGYYCYKCNNTGIKLKNGLTCQDCYARFAHQSGTVRVLHPGSSGPFSSGNRGAYYPHYPGSLPPRVVSPGDPSIGGVLCGRCRGRGRITFFLDDEQCPTCRGVGRLL